MVDFMPRIRYTNVKQAEYLHCEIDRLLGDIDQATKRGDLHKQEYLQRMYNRSMDQLFGLKIGPLGDPIEALPRELWIMILKEAVSEEIDKADRMLELTLVSTRWQSTLITTPDLWTYITIKDEPGEASFDTLAKMTTILTLSGDSLMHLDILQSQKYWESMLALLQPCANRIVAIRVYERVTHLTPLLLSLGDLPQLKCLESIGWGSTNLKCILEHAPGLVTVKHDDLDVTHPNLKNLRECTTDQRLSNLVTGLDSFVHLTSLTLRPPSLDQERSIDSLLVPPALSLQCLEFDQDELVLAINLIEISPKLTTININIQTEWMILFKLVDISSRLIHLVMLVLYLDVPSKRVEFPSNTHNLPIKTLKLFIRGESGSEVTETHSHNTPSLWNYLKHHTPLIENLHLSLSPAEPVPFDYINGMPNLRLLSLFTTSPTETSPESFNIDQLEILEMVMTAKMFEILMPKFRPGTIKRLIYRFWDSDPIPHASDMQYPACPSVRFVTLSRGPILHGLDGLPSLTRLIFDICNGGIISDFCMRLILQPGSCPKLEQIEFCRCLPEWDLLILMLERRNLLLDTTISPIRALEFSRRLSPMLSSVLVQLLHRKYPIRPSNRELSSQGMAETFLNTSRPTCWPCYQACMVCPGWSFDGKRHLYYPNSRFLATPSMPPIPPLSLELETWLQGRSDRHQWIEQLDRNSFTMITRCSVYGRSGRLVLTELSPYVESNWINSLMPDASHNHRNCSSVIETPQGQQP